jgi:hypothetical protein
MPPYFDLLKKAVGVLERLISSLPKEDFGLRMIRYIPPDISFTEVFYLNQYRSVPFLLNLSEHEDDREIRLYARYRGEPSSIPNPPI